jgi:poly(3-hydroxybutyrate) depolymerase
LPPGPNVLDPVPSTGCGKPLTIATGQWVSQPAVCAPGVNNQGTPACQAIPPGSTVPAMATMGSPEYRGWWVQVPTGYDPKKPYTVIYDRQGCGDGNYFHAGADGYPFNMVDDGQAIQVGLDYDTYSDVPGCPDARDPQSNDLVFMPWLMNEIESTYCVDTTREWIAEYADDNSAAQQFDCAFPAKFRGQVIVTGSEPGAPGYPGGLPVCHPAPMAAFYVHDQNDTDDTYASILPGCARVLTQNGCSNTTCNPRDASLTTAYPVPAGVKLPLGSSCVQFNSCPAQYPVVFCLTQNQDHSDDQNWGVVTLFWDFISRSLPARACAAGQGNENGVCEPCPSGQTACNGFCVDEQTDSNNCGACGASCPLVGASCQGGVCGGCPIGEDPCPVVGGLIGKSTCLNEQTDPSNCGGCQNVCPTGVSCKSGTCNCPIAGQSASNGMCCPGGQTACNGSCIEVKNDPNNCGSCDTQCPSGSCVSGICVPCPAGEMGCFGACVNLNTDPQNCGGCGEECILDGSAPFCVGGVCSPN